MDNNFSFKELYDVSLKSTYPMEVNGRTIEIGETIIFFDKVQIGNFQEGKKFTSANGGRGNSTFIIWEEEKNTEIEIAQGVFSKEQMSFMTGARLLQATHDPIHLSQREYLESDENGSIILKYAPLEPIFIYERSTGDKITPKEINNNVVIIDKNYCDVIIDYSFNYNDLSEIFQFGDELIGGFLSLEGKTRVKDDKDGHTKTGIIRIPKLKLMSKLSMRLGQGVTPVTGYFKAVAVPVGPKGKRKTVEMIILNDDIDSDF